MHVVVLITPPQSIPAHPTNHKICGMTKHKTDKTLPGPPLELTSRINHLSNLLLHLPLTLPLDPSKSKYSFFLDPDEVTDKGIFGAFGNRMESCFETYKAKDQPIHFTERGKRLKALADLMKTAVGKMTDGERTVFREVWLERLIRAAIADGAKIPPKNLRQKRAGSVDLDLTSVGRLTDACLTLRKAHNALNEYLRKDPTLREEIQERCGRVEGLVPREAPVEADIDEFSVDDTDIPLSEVIHDAVGLRLDISTHVNGDFNFLVEKVMKNIEGELVSAGENEDIWAYNGMGEKWLDTDQLPMEPTGDE